MDADAQIIKWARFKWGSSVKDVAIHDPHSFEGCDTCGWGAAITSTVVLTFSDGERAVHDVDFDTDLIREILSA